EFHEASLHFGPLLKRRLVEHSTTRVLDLQRAVPSFREALDNDVDRRTLQADYRRYARVATGQQLPTGPEWQAVAADPAGLDRYIHDYLPYEILHWGGAIAEMFPETCREMHEKEIPLDDFVPWWFEVGRALDRPYDFFLLKIDRWLEFVIERAPGLLSVAEREATVLRTAYADANETVRPIMESTR
ncbi:MAG TPA: hypothetical protein VF732_02235, partial [Nitrospira sp.]